VNDELQSLQGDMPRQTMTGRPKGRDESCRLEGRLAVAVLVAAISIPATLGIAIFAPPELRDNFGVLLTAVATVSVAWFTFTLWRSTDRMQQITAETLEHLRREFEAEHRPWIRVATRPITGLMFDETSPYPTACFEFAFFNSGRSPALRLWADFGIVPPDGDPIASQRALALREMAKPLADSSPGISVFPNQEATLRLLHTMPPSLIQSWIRWMEATPDLSAITQPAHLVGCVTYSSATGHKRFQTGIIVELHRFQHPAAGLYPIDPRLGSVDVISLTTAASAFGGGMVD
jgi:hypothetical protein